MAKHHGPQIKDDVQYEALRRQGAGKEKAARIANTGREAAARRGGKAPAYEEWTKDELYQRAKELDVEQRSGMSKDELIDALRDR
jgi:Rho termination factor, N-terminal domain